MISFFAKNNPAVMRDYYSYAFLDSMEHEVLVIFSYDINQFGTHLNAVELSPTFSHSW